MASYYQPLSTLGWFLLSLFFHGSVTSPIGEWNKVEEIARDGLELNMLPELPVQLSLLRGLLNESAEVYAIDEEDEKKGGSGLDYVILPRGNESDFPYFVRITMLKVDPYLDKEDEEKDKGGSNNLANLQSEKSPSSLPAESSSGKPIPVGTEINGDEDEDASVQSVGVHVHSLSPGEKRAEKEEIEFIAEGGWSTPFIHWLAYLMYFLTGIGVILFLLHNVVSCVGLWRGGGSGVEDIELLDDQRSTRWNIFSRRAKTPFVVHRYAYEPL